MRRLLQALFVALLIAVVARVLMAAVAAIVGETPQFHATDSSIILLIFVLSTLGWFSGGLVARRWFWPGLAVAVLINVPFLFGAYGIAADEVADKVPGRSLIVQISVLGIAASIGALMALVGVVGWRLGRGPPAR